jgi:hypothetical protein
MLNSEQEDEECDATDDHSSTAAWLKIKNTVALMAIRLMVRR